MTGAISVQPGRLASLSTTGPTAALLRYLEATDLRNAGATWTPARTHVDRALITAQGLDDIDEFTTLLIDAVSRSAGTRTPSRHV